LIYKNTREKRQKESIFLLYIHTSYAGTIQTGMRVFLSLVCYANKLSTPGD